MSVLFAVPPRFLARPKNLAAQVNMDAELECDVAGVPRPSITWMKNGEVVIHSDYFQVIEGRNLRILGLVHTDAGMYQCFAENSVGTVQASAQLMVTQPGKAIPSVYRSTLTPVQPLLIFTWCTYYWSNRICVFITTHPTSNTLHPYYYVSTFSPWC